MNYDVKLQGISYGKHNCKNLKRALGHRHQKECDYWLIFLLILTSKPLLDDLSPRWGNLNYPHLKCLINRAQSSFFESLMASVNVLNTQLTRNVVDTSPHTILLCQEKNNYTGKIPKVSNYEIQAHVTSILLTEPVNTSKLKCCNWKVVSTLLKYCTTHSLSLCVSS